MNRRRLHSLLVGAALLAPLWEASARADPVVTAARPSHGDGWLRVEVLARDLLDARTRSTVESGLPGTCVYHITLHESGRDIVGERFLQMSLRLDLWEDRYVLDGPGGLRFFANLAAADSAWAHLQDVPVLPVDQLRPESSYRLQVRVAVRPIAPEDRARISRYVSQSSGDREEFALDLGALLERFFRGEDAEEGVVSFVGPLFRGLDLEEGP